MDGHGILLRFKAFYVRGEKLANRISLIEQTASEWSRVECRLSCFNSQRKSRLKSRGPMGEPRASPIPLEYSPWVDYGKPASVQC